MVFVYSSIVILVPAINTFCFVYNANVNSACVTSPIDEMVFVNSSIVILVPAINTFVLHLMPMLILLVSLHLLMK